MGKGLGYWAGSLKDSWEVAETIGETAGKLSETQKENLVIALMSKKQPKFVSEKVFALMMKDRIGYAKAILDNF